MKKAELEFVTFVTEDVITTSGAPAPDPGSITHYRYNYGTRSGTNRASIHYQKYIDATPFGNEITQEVSDEEFSRITDLFDNYGPWFSDPDLTSPCSGHTHPSN